MNFAIKMTKQTKILIGIGVLAIAGLIIYKRKTDPTNPVMPTPGCDPSDPRCLGAQTDSHGCVLDAGYIWDYSLQKCVQPWLINL